MGRSLRLLIGLRSNRTWLKTSRGNNRTLLLWIRRTGGRVRAGRTLGCKALFENGSAVDGVEFADEDVEAVDALDFAGRDADAIGAVFGALGEDADEGKSARSRG